VRKLLLTGLGTGYLPVAPGTWGSAAVAGVFLLVAWASGGEQAWLTGSMLALALAGSGTCLTWGGFAEKAFGRKDPSQCTADEWAGQAVALLLLPAGPDVRRWLAAAGVAFLAFRFFDILKPSPARRLQRLRAGWGILVDDLIAGVYANLVAQLLLRLWPAT